MSTAEEREKVRHRLRELAESAAPVAADSSGYVDLSAYSASDPDWIERALARSKAGGPARPAPTVDSRALGSVAPVAVTNPAEIPPASRRSHGRPLVIASAILAGVTAALVLALGPLPLRVLGARADDDDARAAHAANPPGDPPALAPLPTPAMSSAVQAAPPVPGGAASATAATAAARVGTTVPRTRVPVVIGPARTRTPSRSLSPPTPKAKSGAGDALTAAILESIAAPSGNKR